MKYDDINYSTQTLKFLNYIFKKWIIGDSLTQKSSLNYFKHKTITKADSWDVNFHISLLRQLKDQHL